MSRQHERGSFTIQSRKEPLQRSTKEKFSENYRQARNWSQDELCTENLPSSHASARRCCASEPCRGVRTRKTKFPPFSKSRVSTLSSNHLWRLEMYQNHAHSQVEASENDCFFKQPVATPSADGISIYHIYTLSLSLYISYYFTSFRSYVCVCVVMLSIISNLITMTVTHAASSVSQRGTVMESLNFDSEISLTNRPTLTEYALSRCNRFRKNQILILQFALGCLGLAAVFHGLLSAFRLTGAGFVCEIT